MWILDPRFGFVSVVLADTEPGSRVPDPDRVMIRARQREHLALLQQRHAQLASFEIVESPPHCDYRWRLVVPKRLFAEALFDAVMDVNYRNAKGEAQRHAKTVGDDYVGALHDVWSVMRGLQA